MKPPNSLITSYASHMSEALVRRRAELEIQAARAEAQLAIKARSEFLANMNHELRTPLNAIIGFASMLRDEEVYPVSPEQRAEYIGFILQSADLLLGHINTVLEVSALESCQVEIIEETLEFNSLLNSAMDRAEIRAKASGVSIEHKGDNRDVEVFGDLERTNQAIDHLLHAAVDATRQEGGRVLVRASTDTNGWGEIAVRDEGDGFSDEELEEALDIFKQVKSAFYQPFSRAGVGYAIAKTFVELQGGRFSIKSQKGKGTLVTIALPPPDKTHEESFSITLDDDGDMTIGERAENAA